MLKTTYEIMKGRQKYKSFFIVEPLSQGNIPLSPTHTHLDMTDHAGPRRYECNPIFQIGTRGICNLGLKLHNPMKNCGT